MELHCTLHTSMKPPLSFTQRYKRNKSRGFLEMVGQLVIGDLFSSMKVTSLSNHVLRSIESSISYNFAKLSGFCKIHKPLVLELLQILYRWTFFGNENSNFYQRIFGSKEWILPSNFETSFNLFHAGAGIKGVSKAVKTSYKKTFM